MSLAALDIAILQPTDPTAGNERTTIFSVVDDALRVTGLTGAA